MLIALTNSQEVTKASLKALMLVDEPSKREDISAMTFTLEESFSQIKVLPVHEIVDIKRKGKQVVTFVNSLGHNHVQMVSVLVNSLDVMVSTIYIHSTTKCVYYTSQVTDSSNDTIASQLNPVFNGDAVSRDKFQLVFVVTLPALGAAHYLITTGNYHAVLAELQYINLSPPSRYIRMYIVVYVRMSNKILCSLKNIIACLFVHNIEHILHR